MEEVYEKITRALGQYGYQFKTVSIGHLPEVQEAVAGLIRQGLISKKLFEKWRFYRESNRDFPLAKTVIIVAMPQPVCRLTFGWQGEIYTGDIPPTYNTRTDDRRVFEALTSVLGAGGYSVQKALLVLKTLAVRSGLARYGRNNLTYISEMGSYFRLAAFYTDWPCPEDHWQDAEQMESCRKCLLCLENCPTGSITGSRFLIQAEKCLTVFNESEDDFPDWIIPGWQNTLVGCMRCQTVCPANRAFLSRIESGPSFTEEETGLILNRIPPERLPAETRRKLESLIVDEIYPVLARNLEVLIEKQGGTATILSGR